MQLGTAVTELRIWAQVGRQLQVPAQFSYPLSKV